MEPRTVTLEGFNVVGLGIDCKDDDTSGIEPLWEKKFFPRFEEIKGGLGIWGVCLPNDDPKGFFYMACCKVADGASVPPGMELRKIPPHKYAVHSYSGLPREMAASWQKTIKEVFPDAGLTLKTYGPWLEMYPDDCYDAETGKITCDLYTPIVG